LAIQNAHPGPHCRGRLLIPASAPQRIVLNAWRVKPVRCNQLRRKCEIGSGSNRYCSGATIDYIVQGRDEQRSKDHVMSAHSTRRRFLTTVGVAASSLGLGTAFTAAAPAQAQLPPTPACGADEAPTVRQGEGPFFKPRSPERADLREPGVKGQSMELAGFVLTRGCRPVERALIDLWHADGEGAYDNIGFRLRGHQFTDAQGRWRFLTIMPASYEGRTRHFHVKVQPPGGRILTTQLYFPGEAYNRTDSLFRGELLMKVAKVEGGLTGRFDFVLDMR
jgi:protocatechuate 3,4-dioxygenase beta subunit